MSPKLSDVLTVIERKEAPLLTWGVVDGSFSHDDLTGLLLAAFPTEDPDDLIADLAQSGLIVVDGVMNPRYRSRMAETVRLAKTLRQWFHGRDWRTAPELVSDIRFMSRARAVPNRSTTAGDLIEEISEQLGHPVDSAQEAAIHALVRDRKVSAFQKRATIRLLATQDAQNDLGTCITAGTGAGKTLAFYLAALAHLAGTPQKATPRLLAVYPRTELLRDQARGLLADVERLSSATGTPLRVGVLYGGVPKNRKDAETGQYRKWPTHPDGLQCPILDCPLDDCGGDLVWREEVGNDQILRCTKCGVDQENLVFTRDALTKKVPDILFTSTEMMNRNLGAGPFRRFFVGDAQTGPSYLLLDEIHTYDGVHGAQVANLLRRWRNMLRHPVHLVGLSATLADPSGFFAQLTGVETAATTVVAPEPDELREIGQEYFLALRGDPASQTSLLSTTIQASMLLRRMMDPRLGHPSHGAYGSRVFVFTDNLDLVNRLHSQLEDAEGWQPGGVGLQPAGSLANLRAPGQSDDRARESAGQLWAFADGSLGTLSQQMRIGRTSSADSGVNTEDDITVATAALEVGFDDPRVGGIVQHKAPRNAAQFLQRRGRAGRDPFMRPWSFVILSGYGRDRLAFQSYETLFDPVVPPSALPLNNRTVLKMQATWWLINRLEQFTQGVGLQWVLSRPWSYNRERQRTICRRLLSEATELLTPSGIRNVEQGLHYSLRQDERAVKSVLWDPPRGLLTSVLPTLIRRLEALDVDDPPSDRWDDPIAGFVPSTLFDDLQTPEVRLDVPFPLEKSEPVAQALREYAPGRVSYRHALRGRRERIWVAPPETPSDPLAIEAFCEDFEDLRPPPGGSMQRVVRPRSLKLERPPPGTQDSTAGHWIWETNFEPPAEPLELGDPGPDEWNAIVATVSAMTHQHRCPVIVWRSTGEFELDHRIAPDPSDRCHALTLNGSPTHLGFAMDVDAVAFDVRVPGHELLEDPPPGLISALAVARLHYCFQHDEILRKRIPSPFLRQWLAEVSLALLADRGQGPGAGDDNPFAESDQFGSDLVEVARRIFGSTPLADDGHGDGSVDDRRLVDEIQQTISDHESLVQIIRLLQDHLQGASIEWVPWIQERFLSTLAAAITEAIQSLCPEVNAESLLPDINFLGDEEDVPDLARIWISENQPGGLGVVEAFVQTYVSDPRTFWALVTRALGPCQTESVEETLRRFLANRKSPPFPEAIAAVRQGEGFDELTDAWTRLRQEMFDFGLDASRSVTSALTTRFLRPKSDPRVDEITQELLERWEGLEASLGHEVDLWVFASVVTADPNIRKQLTTIVGAVPGDELLASQVVGLLWPRGWRVRSSGLQNYNPFTDLEPTERFLFSALLRPPSVPIDSQLAGWRAKVDDAINSDGDCRIYCPDHPVLREVLSRLVADPTLCGVLELHPRVIGLARAHDGFLLSIELREAQL
ncbi:MAG: DEAD/DEAH box helicase [Gemmatimonadales bacterium]|jgi:superfamily II DNA/RNA helicase|nr:DEAD/DEAH box helicase [Gemmatimonadales bacterium]MBT7693841.1 DEAD/DEAH box helicase [Gemmatimonadales bacterium]